MSAPEPAVHGAQHLLVVIDPDARRSDGESVRIAKDVLSAGAAVKMCFPEGPEEFARVLARRGHKRPVVVGDDRALLRTVTLLHRERDLSAGALSLVPVGADERLALAHALGVPTNPVAAARAVLEGQARRLDLLVDDSDGVVVGDLRIPALPEASPRTASVWHTCRTLVRTFVPDHGGRPATAHRLRVEADGEVLCDLDSPVEGITVRSRGGGRAEVVVRTPVSQEPLRARARSVTVSGSDFRYQADARLTGPVRTRTWTLRPDAWALTLPAG